MAEKAILGARQAVPGWGQLEVELFKSETITGGLTNKLNLVYLQGDVPGQSSKALVRIFGQGTDEFIDREAEQVVCSAMSGTGIAPRVYGLFPGGRAEEFIDNARSIFNKDLHKPDILCEVARLMALMHSVDLDDSANAVLVKSQMATPKMLRRLWNGACRAKFDLDAKKALKLAALQVGSLAHEVDWLEKQLLSSGMGKVLCHRDLQSGNVMVQDPADNATGEDRKVYLIDFEYSGMDFCAFDFGNLFCEMSLHNFATRFPGFVLDPDMYPSEEQQRAFFSEYLKHVREPSRLFPSATAETMDQAARIDLMCKWAELGALASHMQWALWGIVQAEHSSIEFGYLEYATARFDQYHSLRREYERRYPDSSPGLPDASLNVMQ